MKKYMACISLSAADSRLAAVFFCTVTVVVMTASAAEFPSRITMDHPVPTGIRVSQQDASTCIVDCDVDGFGLQTKKLQQTTWIKPVLDGLPGGLEQGAPDLPHFSCSLVIPDTGNVAVRIVAAEYEDFADMPVLPSRGSIPRTIDPDTVPYVFGEAYAQTVWPGQRVQAGTPYILRDYRGCTLRVTPFRYFPQTRTLRVFKHLKMAVVVRGSDGVNTLQRSAAPGRLDADFSGVYASHFANFNAQTRYTPLNDQGELLVVAADSLAGAVQPLVRWKREKGIPTTLVPLSDIGSTANEIKTFVQGYYNTNGLTFLLLVGDAGDVPTLTASTGSSDPSYSKLAGSDNYPDIFVGRFSGSTSNQIANMVTRTIRYEQWPDSSGAWYEKATGLASAEGSAPSDIEHMNAIRTKLLNSTYSQVDQIYDPGASASEVSTAVNAGRGLINYVGHGDVQEWVTSGFVNSDVDSLTNTVKWPVIFDVACVNGQFAGSTCFAEAWIRASHNGNPAGAAAIYASTINQEWEPPMTAQNEFNDLLLAHTRRTFGGLCFNASMKMMDDWSTDGVNMFNTWTVFGDPSLAVRTRTPSNLTVQCEDTVAGTSFAVRVVGVEGALAALSLDGALLGSAYTDSGGDAQIHLSAQPAEPVLLTVTALNAVPHTNTLQPGAPAFLSWSPSAISNNVPSGTDALTTLHIANTGDVSSSLSYAIEILPDYGSRSSESRLLDTAERRNLTGSTVSFSISEYIPGSNATVTITAENGSDDDEWLAGLTLDFPADITLNSANTLIEDEWGYLDFDGPAGSGVTAAWNAPDPTNNAVVFACTGTCELSFSAAASGDLDVGWTLTGDEFGTAPHTVTGTITLACSGPPAPSLSLTSPAGGESWARGSTQSVTWSSANVTQAVDLLCSVDGGSTWSSIVADTVDDGSHPWVVDAVQSTNAFIRVQTANAATQDQNTDPFLVYEPLNWLSVSMSSNVLSGGDSNSVTVTLDAAGKTPGSYHALLRLATSSGTEEIPVTMHVIDGTNTYTLWADADVHGTVLPSGSFEVTTGHSTQFLIQADADYYIASVLTNGSSVAGAAGLSVFTSVWTHVSHTGSLWVTFASVSSNTAANETPVPWLRAYYANESDLTSLVARADQDTDGDGLAGWQEYIARTDPTLLTSSFLVGFDDPGAGPDPHVLTWWAATDRTYTIYFASNLLSGFEVIQSNMLPNADGMISYTDTVSRADRSIFYRVRVQR